MKFFEELKRRNVPKASLAYLVIAWVLLQVFQLLLPMVNAPEWVLKTLTLILALGFPLWVIFSWTYEITPEGIKKTKEVSIDNSITETTNKRLNILILIALVIAITVGLMFRPLYNNDRELVTVSIILDKSIAVLPFDDMSSSGDNEWFCDGMTEDILTKLSKIKELKVISRTSTEQYKNSDKTIPEIAKELGVSYVLEGSVRKHENKIIITAQLIDLNDRHIWSDNYSDDFNEVFKIQQEVAEKIVEQLKITISPEEEKALAAYPTDNMEAYQLYLQGRNFIEKWSEENEKIGIDLLKQAIALDPNFGDVYAELGLATLGGNDSINDISKQYFEKALKINPNSSRALSYYGIFLVSIEENNEEGLNYLEKAIEINPNDAKAHDMMALYYIDVFEENESKIHLKYL